MILNDGSIASAIDSGKIVIEPEITGNQIQPASLDVRLDRDVVLEPGEPQQPLTKDYIELPNDIAAMLTGRSSIARNNVIVHKTAGFIDPGFRGQILLEMLNFGKKPASYNEGDRVAQLIFFPLICRSRGYDGKYQDQGDRKS